MKDVETLLDNRSNYDGKKVTVTGELSKKIDARSFVLEGGGIVNDEVVVISTQGSRDTSIQNALKENKKVTVTGTVRTDNISTLKKEMNWNLDSATEADLVGARAFLISDQVIAAQ